MIALTNLAHWTYNCAVVVSAVPIGLGIRWLVFRHHKGDDR